MNDIIKILDNAHSELLKYNTTIPQKTIVNQNKKELSRPSWIALAIPTHNDELTISSRVLLPRLFARYFVMTNDTSYDRTVNVAHNLEH
jgi:hypothetical protein